MALFRPIPREIRLALCAPVLLCAVAARQIYLARASDLSPWKGGGFGMFSTVASPGARFIRLYLLLDGMEVPVAVPTSLRQQARAVRTLPSPGRLTQLAGLVARGTWVPFRLVSAPEYFRQKASLAVGDPLSPVAAAVASRAGPLEAASAALPFPGLFRMVGQGEPAPPPGDALGFHHVRAELWTYRFDPGSGTLQAGLLLSTVVPAGP